MKSKRKVDIFDCWAVGGALGMGAGLLLGIILALGSCAAGAKGGDAIAILVLCLLGGPIVGFFLDYKSKEAAIEESERKSYQEDLERETAEQRSLYSQIERNAAASLNLFEELPSYLLKAEELLDQAERDFKESAFSPFWSSIEHATTRLGSFDDNIRTITKSSEWHGQNAGKFNGVVPRFPLAIDSVRGIGAANSTLDRLNAIVRQAQRNFQFATIYEQRKTNQILIAGFQTLAQALDGMGQRIEASIDDLGGRMSEMSSAMEKGLLAVAEQGKAGNNRLVAGVRELHVATQENASNMKQRHDRALEMLDNIQRRRMPTGFYLNLGTKPAP